jgi:hypothetical protein
MRRNDRSYSQSLLTLRLRVGIFLTSIFLILKYCKYINMELKQGQARGLEES